MRICIVGAGSIGSLFAGHLATVTDVVVLTRRAEHARALNEHGLRVSGRHDFTARVTAAADPRDLSDFDLGIIATKANNVEAAAESLDGRFAGATMMTVQNGLGAEEIMRAHGDWPLVSAVTFMSGTKHSDTHVEYVLDTPTWLGPYADTPFARVQELAHHAPSLGIGEVQTNRAAQPRAQATCERQETDDNEEVHGRDRECEEEQARARGHPDRR